jgi:phosphoribosylformimino-5-aminoimidazole carboxamide ribotide isomerase
MKASLLTTAAIACTVATVASALTGHNVEATRAMIHGTGLRVIASGGVATVADIHALAELREPRLDGVIVGKALYEGHIAIDEALSIGPRKTG